ncbi:MAG: RNB domain-containing ribonuclease [Candidatus Riflebacteria bacterium]|nr:RNB domain-containing ribonuclease [Candidatus Riflebacteria bacterium]
MEFSDREEGNKIGIVLSVSGKGVRVLLTNRRETTVTERNILHLTSTSKSQCSDIDAALEVLLRHDLKRKSYSDQINLDELHLLLSEEIRGYQISEMTGFVSDSPDDDFTAALIRALTNDSFYFKEKKEGWVPQPRQQVQEAIERENKRKQKELEEQALIDELEQLFQKGTSVEISEKLAPVIDKIVDYVVFQDEYKGDKRVVELLQKAGMANFRKLFSLLVKINRFHPDENILLRQKQISTEFSAEVQSEAESLVSKPLDTNGRTDLTELFTMAIDGEETKDRDDAFSVSRDSDGNFTLWVHIADAAHFIVPDSEIDRDASSRATSIYMPDKVIPMVPAILSEGAISLNQGSPRLAITVKMSINAAGEITEHSVFPSTVKVALATDYNSADEMISSNATLSDAIELFKVLRSVRVKAGALVMSKPELEIKVKDEKIILRERNRSLSTSEMISEFMIWANHITAKFAMDNKIPFIYRSQPACENLPPNSPEFDALVFFQTIKQLKRSETCSQPSLHGCLAVNPYCQITSPIRRYCDLLLQRQLKNFLSHNSPLYEIETLEQKLVYADHGLATGEEAMEKRYMYFLLKHLKNEISRGNDTISGVVLENGYNETTVFLNEICRINRCRKPGFDVAPGNKVKIKMKQADPFDETFKFEILSIKTAES